MAQHKRSETGRLRRRGKRGVAKIIFLVKKGEEPLFLSSSLPHPSLSFLRLEKRYKLTDSWEIFDGGFGILCRFLLKCFSFSILHLCLLRASSRSFQLLSISHTTSVTIFEYCETNVLSPLDLLFPSFSSYRFLNPSLLFDTFSFNFRASRRKSTHSRRYTEARTCEGEDAGSRSELRK